MRTAEDIRLARIDQDSIRKFAEQAIDKKIDRAFLPSNLDMNVSWREEAVPFSDYSKLDLSGKGYYGGFLQKIINDYGLGLGNLWDILRPLVMEYQRNGVHLHMQKFTDDSLLRVYFEEDPVGLQTPM